MIKEWMLTHSVWKWKSKIVFILREHAHQWSKFYGIYKSATRTSIWVYESHRIESWSIKINCISMC